MNNWVERAVKVVYRWIGIDKGPEGFDEFLETCYVSFLTGGCVAGPGFVLFGVFWRSILVLSCHCPSSPLRGGTRGLAKLLGAGLTLLHMT